MLLELRTSKPATIQNPVHPNQYKPKSIDLILCASENTGGTFKPGPLVLLREKSLLRRQLQGNETAAFNIC